MNVKKVNCINFEYCCTAKEEELALSSELRLTAQAPFDKTLLERAILVDVRIKNKDGTFRINGTFRVVFPFERPEDIIEGQVLLQKCQQKAYDEVKDIVRNFLKSIQQNERAFPDMT